MYGRLQSEEVEDEMVAIQDQNMLTLQERTLPYFTQITRRGVEGVDFFHQTGLLSIGSAFQWIDISGYDQQMTFQTTPVALFCSSGDNADAFDIDVFGYDANGKHQVVRQTLAGNTKTRVGTTETFLFQYKVMNVLPGASAAVVHVYEDDTVTLGIPDTPAKRKLNIPIVDFPESQAMVAYIPPGKEGFLLSINVGNSTTSGMVSRVKMIQPGGVIRTQPIPSCVSLASSRYKIVKPIPEGTIMVVQVFVNVLDVVTGSMNILLKDK